MKCINKSCANKNILVVLLVLLLQNFPKIDDIKETQCKMVGTISTIGASLNKYLACASFYSEAFIYKSHCVKRYLIPKHPLQMFKEIF